MSSSNSKKKFLLSSIIIFGIVLGFDVNQCPASSDLFTSDFDVVQLCNVTKSNIESVKLIIILLEIVLVRSVNFLDLNI